MGGGERQQILCCVISTPVYDKIEWIAGNTPPRKVRLRHMRPPFCRTHGLYALTVRYRGRRRGLSTDKVFFPIFSSAPMFRLRRVNPRKASQGERLRVGSLRVGNFLCHNTTCSRWPVIVESMFCGGKGSWSDGEVFAHAWRAPSETLDNQRCSGWAVKRLVP